MLWVGKRVEKVLTLSFVLAGSVQFLTCPPKAFLEEKAFPHAHALSRSALCVYDCVQWLAWPSNACLDENDVPQAQSKVGGTYAMPFVPCL